MDLLPDDIVLEIFSHLDIDSFFSARCVSKRIHDITNARIGGLAVAIAHTTFPGQVRVHFQRRNDVPGIAWLNSMRYRQLAAILLECFNWDRTGHDFDAPPHLYLHADDPLGDHLREKLELGLKVVASISQIVRGVAGMPAELVQKQKIPPGFDYFIGLIDPTLLEVRRECVILDHCEYYISQLCAEDLQGIKYIRDALLQHDTFWYRGKGNLFSDDFYESGFELASWAAWKLIKMGPSVFWKIWWSDRENRYPQKTASRILRTNRPHKRSYDIMRTECEVFRMLCFRFRKAEETYQTKSRFAVSYGPRPGLTTKPQPTPLVLYYNMWIRIAPLWIERKRLSDSTESCKIESLLRGTAATSQTLRLADFIRINEFENPYSSPRRLIWDNTHVADTPFANLDTAIAYEKAEKEWLDRERAFGHKTRWSLATTHRVEKSRISSSIAANPRTRKHLLRAKGRNSSTLPTTKERIEKWLNMVDSQ